MSILMMKLLQPYMAENDGEGGGTGGGAPTDRGDSVEANDASTAANTAAAAAADDDQASKDLEEITGDKEDRTRDENGRFTKKGDAHVPKARFDEAVGKERAAREAAEARAAELAAKLKQEEKNVEVEQMESAVEKLEQQHAKLLLEGEADKAAAIMKQIRQAERQIARMENDEKSSQATAAAVEQVRMEAAIAKLEADNPAFNPDSEDFDQDLVDIVLAEQARLIRQQGMVPSKALTTAAEKIMKKFAPAAADKEGAKGLAAAKGSADRKAGQVAKNLDTANRQPASMKEAGMDSDKAGAKIDGDINHMSAEEFAALPAATQAKLRGDFV